MRLVHYYPLQVKHQNQKTANQLKKKVKIVASAVNVMEELFWNTEGFICLLRPKEEYS